MPISASIEDPIADLSEADEKLFLEDLGMDEPGLNCVIRATDALLGLLGARGELPPAPRSANGSSLGCPFQVFCSTWGCRLLRRAIPSYRPQTT